MIERHEPLQVKVPVSAPRSRNGVLARCGEWGLRRLGWAIKGEFSDTPKMIVIVAPHSSNWDWIIGVCALWALEMKFTYLIKDAACIWPLSIVIRRTGGLPIDRKNPKGLVEQIVDEFDRSEKLYYAITPEGTRKEVVNWKTGFLRVAYKTNAPVVPACLNYQKREITISSPFNLSGKTDSDMKMIRAHFDDEISL